MDLESSYKNPFTDYHANRIDVPSLLEYWCDPWSFFQILGLDERRFFSEAGPLVFEGGRGSGKTMFLRYFSVDVQAVRWESSSSEISITEYLNRLGGIGIYLRFDGAVLGSFKGNNLSDEFWQNMFAHYFELFVAREYVVALEHIVAGDPEVKLDKFMPRAFELITGEESQAQSLADLKSAINSQLREITDFRAAVGFGETKFNPTKAFMSQGLSFGLVDLIRESLPRIDNKTNFILLIDEFENFNESQQRMVNTLLKFATDNLTFRLGMRKNGWRDTGTVNPDDFIKETRDYERFVFEEVLHARGDSRYSDFLVEVASKRLNRVSYYADAGNTDIREFLGGKEDLEQEALRIVGDSNLERIDNYYCSKFKIPQLAPCKNPLVRVLGYLWLLRGESLEMTNVAIRDFEEKRSSKERQKFRYDYTNKYKLSLTFLLASIYRKEKNYYSFNTFSYLSSGMIGHFLELCRYAFRHAEFESTSGTVDGLIRPDLQARAAKDVALNQVKQVKRISDYGDELYWLVKNLGGIFGDYHQDVRIRYPETNQFSLDQSALKAKEKAVFDAAVMWSVIQQKPNLQGDSPGSKRTELYTLNRVFSPVFQISYRTRGGISESYVSDDFLRLIRKEKVEPKRKLNVDNGDVEDIQTNLF